MKNIHTCKTIFFLSVLVLLLSSGVNAGMTARSIGLGDEFVALAGPDALYSNPAALDINDNSFVLQFNMAGEVWNNIFMNDVISDSDKDNLLKIADKKGILVSADGVIGGKMAIGPVTLFADGRGNSLFKMSPDLAELLINGNEIEGKYDFDGTEGAGSFYTDTGVNYAFKLSDSSYLGSLINDKFEVKNTYLGFTYHYLTGAFVKYSGSGGLEMGFDEDGEPFVEGNDGEVKAYYSEIDDFKDTAKGHAFDLGFYTELDDKYSWDFSILNIGGSLTADKVKEYKYRFEYDEETDEWDTIEPPDDGTLIEGKTKMKLPLIIKLGGKMKFRENIDLLANYTITNYSDSIYSDSLTDHRFSAATEISSIKFLPLRLGVNYSTLQNDFDISAGMGLYLGPFRMDAGISDLSGLFYKSKGVAGGLNFSLVF